MCVILGAIIYLMDLRFPTQIASFFGVDVLQDEFEEATADGTITYFLYTGFSFCWHPNLVLITIV